MQLDQIILYKNVVEQKTISQAAKLCHISQPAASKQLQNLEEELGVRLIERTNRGIKVTEAGRIFYEFTLSVDDMYGNVTTLLSDWKYNRESLDVISSPVIANYVLPSGICDLKKDYPHFSFNIIPENSTNVIDSILMGQSKLGFAVDVDDHRDLVKQKMFDDEIILVACSDYEIDSEIVINDLKDHLVIILDKSDIFYHKVHDYCRLIGIDIESKQNIQQFYTIESIKNLLINCCGISFIPRRAVEKEISKGFIKQIKIDGLYIPYEVYAITHVNNAITPVMMEIIEQVKK